MPNQTTDTHTHDLRTMKPVTRFHPQIHHLHNALPSLQSQTSHPRPVHPTAEPVTHHPSDPNPGYQARSLHATYNPDPDRALIGER